MVSSELETAHAVSRTIGLPAAKQTDVFADGQVQIVEFDVPREGSAESPQADAFKEVVGLQLKEASIPADSKVASIIRGDRLLVPRGDESILPGDRIIVIGSPDAARQWSAIMARSEQRMDDVVIYGAGATGLAIAHILLEQRMRVRSDRALDERAREVGRGAARRAGLQRNGNRPGLHRARAHRHAHAAVFALRED